MTAVLVGLLFVFGFSACSSDDEPINGITITTREAASLQFMREEEKLARDIYQYLYEMYSQAIFSNIANSEQSHMDAVKTLLDKYKVDDPVKTDIPGKFVNAEIQELYNALKADGNIDVAHALKVGATIEDLDIYDLMDELEVMKALDIIQVYESLWKGSRNHLRAFYTQILAIGETYTPQYISQAYFDEIVNSPIETGN